MTDPRELIAKSPMSPRQALVVAITIALNALDGFDVLSISFASPGIAAEWKITRAALGFVLSMELIGMALGSIFLGSLADKIGRRPTVLGCLVVMATGMFMATTSNGILGSLVMPVFGPLAAMFDYTLDVRLADLSMWRIVTGLGIGGMLAAINAVVAEFSNTKRRDLNVAIMSIGYPVGAALGGFITSTGLELAEWRSVFYFGATVTVAMIPTVYFLMPESVHWLTRKQPAGALERINRTLVKFGHAAVAELPAVSADQRKRSSGDLFRPPLLLVTVLCTAAYFFHITTFYYIVKWVPTIVVGMGFAPSSAGYVLSWLNVGGATGGTVLGLLSQRYPVKWLTIGVMLLSTIAVTFFGRSPADLTKLILICMISGFCTNAAITGMYAIFAKAFPTHVRASGTGIAVGVGRGGSVLAPIIAGFLFTSFDPSGKDLSAALPPVSMIMGLGSLVAAVVLLNLRVEERH
ncbi:MAG TPA: MFS transporter [Vicinamibacterales bacterium]|jgi:MFS family permease|nr:MFS transporter [Vicinamibacterales bacterium]